MHNNSIQQSELWEISRRLVAYNTVSSGSNVEAAQYLGNLLEESGFVVHLLRETIMGVEKAMVLAWAGPLIPGGLIVSGHIDVVPFEGQPGWRSDPLAMHLEGERIIGRGVSDMKVFLAQAILAARAHSLSRLKKPLVYIFTCDEEVAGQGSARLIMSIPRLFADYPLPTVALIGEPTNFEIFPAHKGYGTFEILVHGKGGHSSNPNHGLNALEKMAEVIQIIKEINIALQAKASPESQRLFPQYPASVFNCALISGGLAPNMIAETCQMTVSVRIALSDQFEEILTSLRERIEQKIVREMKKVDPACGIAIQNIITTPPLHSPTDSEFCQLLERIIGKRVEQGAPFGTDGGQFQQIGINSYICGPGLLAEAHQPNESIPVSNFCTGTEKLAQIIQAWCMH